MLNSWFNFSFTDSKIPLISGEITSFKVIYEIMELPKFEMSAVLATPIQDIGPIEFTLTINNGTLQKVFTCTITKAEGTLIYGYILPKVSLFMRKSRSLTTTLSSALRTLNIRNKIDKVSITSVEPFLQLNETDAECFYRIANYCGQGKLWAISYDKVGIFDILPAFGYDFDVNTLDGFVKFDSSNTYTLDISDKASVNSLPNLYYKTENIMIPSTCKFSRECVISYLEKQKFKQWKNVTLKKKFKGSMNVDLGTGIKVAGFKNNKFIISKIEIVYTNSADMYIYEASSYQGWDAYYG